MPTLIEAADSTAQFFYMLYGTQDYESTLEWYVDQGAIDDDVPLKEDYIDIYDGYTLNLYQMEMEYDVDVDGDHSLLCLLAKEACNCAICAGLYWDDDEDEVL
jgi:hypothetical protein